MGLHLPKEWYLVPSLGITYCSWPDKVSGRLGICIGTSSSGVSYEQGDLRTVPKDRESSLLVLVRVVWRAVKAHVHVYVLACTGLHEPSVYAVHIHGATLVTVSLTMSPKCHLMTCLKKYFGNTYYNMDES